MTDQSIQICNAVSILWQNSNNRAAFEEGVNAFFKNSAQTKRRNTAALVVELTKVTSMLLDEVETQL